MESKKKNSEYWLECVGCGNCYSPSELKDDKKFDLYKVYKNWKEYCYECKNCQGVEFFIKIEKE